MFTSRVGSVVFDRVVRVFVEKTKAKGWRDLALCVSLELYHGPGSRVFKSIFPLDFQQRHCLKKYCLIEVRVEMTGKKQEMDAQVVCQETSFGLLLSEGAKKQTTTAGEVSLWLRGDFLGTGEELNVEHLKCVKRNWKEFDLQKRKNSPKTRSNPRLPTSGSSSDVAKWSAGR